MGLLTRSKIKKYAKLLKKREIRFLTLEFLMHTYVQQ